VLTIHSTPRAESNGSPILTNRFGDRLQNLQSKPRPVLDGPSVLVRPLIRHILQELINQVPVRTVDHDAVESSLVHSDLSRPLEPFNVLLDLRNGERSRDDASATDLHIRWGDRDDALTWVVGFENVRGGGWTDSPELAVDE